MRIKIFILIIALSYASGASILSFEPDYKNEPETYVKSVTPSKNNFPKSSQYEDFEVPNDESLVYRNSGILSLGETQHVTPQTESAVLYIPEDIELDRKRLEDKESSSFVPKKLDENSKADAIIYEEEKNLASFMWNLIPKGENIVVDDLENGDKEEAKEFNVIPRLPSSSDTDKAWSTNEEESNYGVGSVKSSPGKKQSKTTIASTGFTVRMHKVPLIGSHFLRDKNLKKVVEATPAAPVNPETTWITTTSELQHEQKPVFPYQIPLPYVRRANDELELMLMHPLMLPNNWASNHFNIGRERTSQIESIKAKRNKRNVSDQPSQELQSAQSHPSGSPIPTQTVSVSESKNNKNSKAENDPHKLSTSTPAEALDRMKRLVSKIIRQLAQFEQKFTMRLIQMNERDDLAKMPEIMKDFQVSEDTPIFFIAGGLKLFQAEEEQTATPTIIPSDPTPTTTSTTEVPTSTVTFFSTQSSSQMPEAEFLKEMSSTPTLPISTSTTSSSNQSQSSTTGLPVELDHLGFDEMPASISPPESSHIINREINEETEMKDRKKRSYSQSEEVDVFPIPGRMARTEDPFEQDYYYTPQDDWFEHGEFIQVRELTEGNTWLNQDSISQSHLVQDDNGEKSLSISNDLNGELSPVEEVKIRSTIVNEMKTDNLNTVVAAASPHVAVESTGSVSIPIGSAVKVEADSGSPIPSMNLHPINRASPSPVANSQVLTAKSEGPTLSQNVAKAKNSTLIEKGSQDGQKAFDPVVTAKGQGQASHNEQSLPTENVKVEIETSVPVGLSIKIQPTVTGATASPVELKPVSNSNPEKVQKENSTLEDQVPLSVAPTVLTREKKVTQPIVTDPNTTVVKISIGKDRKEENPLEQGVKVATGESKSSNAPVKPSAQIGTSSGTINTATGIENSDEIPSTPAEGLLETKHLALRNKVKETKPVVKLQSESLTQNKLVKSPLILEKSKPVLSAGTPWATIIEAEDDIQPNFNVEGGPTVTEKDAVKKAAVDSQSQTTFENLEIPVKQNAKLSEANIKPVNLNLPDAPLIVNVDTALPAIIPTEKNAQVLKVKDPELDQGSVEIASLPAAVIKDKAAIDIAEPEVSQANLHSLKLSPIKDSKKSPIEIVNVPHELSVVDKNVKTPVAQLEELKQPDLQIKVSALKGNSPSNSDGNLALLNGENEPSQPPAIPLKIYEEKTVPELPFVISTPAPITYLNADNSKITSGAAIADNSKKVEKNAEPINENLQDNFDNKPQPVVVELTNAELIETKPEVIPEIVAISVPHIKSSEEDNKPNPVIPTEQNIAPNLQVKETKLAKEESIPKQTLSTEKNKPDIIATTSPSEKKQTLHPASILNLSLSAPASSLAPSDSDVDKGTGEKLTKLPTSETSAPTPTLISPVTETQTSQDNLGIPNTATPIIAEHKDSHPTTFVPVSADLEAVRTTDTENKNESDILPSLVSNASPKPLPAFQPALQLPQLSIPILPQFKPTIPERPHPEFNYAQGNAEMDPNAPVIIAGPTVDPFSVNISSRRKQQLMQAFLPALD